MNLWLVYTCIEQPFSALGTFKNL